MRYPKVLWIIGRGGDGIESILMFLLLEIDEETGLGAIIARRIFGFWGFLLGFESKNRGERESKMKRTDARKAVFKLLTCHEGLPREHLEF